MIVGTERITLPYRYYRIHHMYAYMTELQYQKVLLEMRNRKIHRDDDEAAEQLLEDMQIGFVYDKRCAPRLK